MRHICYTLLHNHFPHLLHFYYTTLVTKNAPHLLHFGYTTISHTSIPHLLHFSYTTLVIKNAPHLLHFGYTFLVHTCYTFTTQHFPTLATLFLHNIGNQKCATFVTLWLHFPCPHLLHFSYTTLVIK